MKINMENHCPECGAPWNGSSACQEAFYQMGYWELDYRLLDVHHLMVLCYHLQHPSLYSPEGLRGALGLLVRFVEGGEDPRQVGAQIRPGVQSGARKYKIKGSPGARGAYPRPVAWTMTALDVVARGREQYYDSVRAWARSLLDSLKDAGVPLLFTPR